ncbi:hypothetical protein OSTOST_03600, partial [Ostertagia ostertagi]
SRVSLESPPVVKRGQPLGSSLQKQLQGALLSEQKIEVIKKNLAGCLDEISNMPPEEFAKVMTTSSLLLPSGDMWTIVQKNFRNCDSSDIPNTKGDLLSWDEKKGYLRTILTRIFLEDIGVGIKATTFVLLSPSYGLLDWMKDRSDPFRFSIYWQVSDSHVRLNGTLLQMEGKILLWAWFQQFSEELPLQDVSTPNVKKAYEELLKHLDELAERRAKEMENEEPIPISDEENALTKMAIAYLSPVNGSRVDLKSTLGGLISDCMESVKKAMNPRALGGEKAWSEVYMVSNRSHMLNGITMSALSYKDDLSIVRGVCDLLRHELPLIREVRQELAEIRAAEKPWIVVYRGIIEDIMKFFQVMTLFEI